METSTLTWQCLAKISCLFYLSSVHIVINVHSAKIIIFNSSIKLTYLLLIPKTPMMSYYHCFFNHQFQLTMVPTWPKAFLRECECHLYIAWCIFITNQKCVVTKGINLCSSFVAVYMFKLFVVTPSKI